jgi:hypothetical protein
LLQCRQALAHVRAEACPPDLIRAGFADIRDSRIAGAGSDSAGTERAFDVFGVGKGKLAVNRQRDRCLNTLTAITPSGRRFAAAGYALVASTVSASAIEKQVDGGFQLVFHLARRDFHSESAKSHRDVDRQAHELLGCPFEIGQAKLAPMPL